MALYQNIPFFTIIICLLSAAITSILKGKMAKYFTLLVLTLVTTLTGILTYHMATFEGAYTFMMGHFPAPWGNEIRIGILESVTALVFSFVMILSVMGGDNRMEEHVGNDRRSLYYVVIELLMAALYAQVYTNDLFTSYVFLEIMTLAACALISSRTKGQTLVASARYMIMNLLGSGLFLLGITLLYDLTGHLLMSNIKESVDMLNASGQYTQPLTVVIALLTIGLSIKSALFPFHTWVPDAYSYATPTSSAILSSLVSKGYIFLLIKIYYRVLGLSTVVYSNISDVLLVFALVGIVMGSVNAIKETDIRRMVAFSSVAQIGYIFLGIGIGTPYGIAAAIFQIFSHSFAKAMLFISVSGLCAVSNESKLFRDLRGAGYRNKLAGVGFTVGACSMVGIPFVGGFIAKIMFARAAMGLSTTLIVIVMIVLSISTLLNTIYFLRTVITLYRPATHPEQSEKKYKNGFLYACAMVLFILFNFALGVGAQPIINFITRGLSCFS